MHEPLRLCQFTSGMHNCLQIGAQLPFAEQRGRDRSEPLSRVDFSLLYALAFGLYPLRLSAEISALRMGLGSRPLRSRNCRGRLLASKQFTAVLAGAVGPASAHSLLAAAYPETPEYAGWWPDRRSPPCPPARAILKPGKAVIGKAPPPVTDNAGLNTNFLGDRARAAALGRQQHDPRPLRLALRRARRSAARLKHLAYLRLEPNLSCFGNHSGLESHYRTEGAAWFRGNPQFPTTVFPMDHDTKRRDNLGLEAIYGSPRGRGSSS